MSQNTKETFIIDSTNKEANLLSLQLDIEMSMRDEGLKKMIDNKKELARLSLQARLSAEANFDQSLVLEDIHQSMGL